MACWRALLVCRCGYYVCVGVIWSWLGCGGDALVKHARAQGGDTALIVATENDHEACVRLLLDAGADKEATDWVR